MLGRRSGDADAGDADAAARESAARAARATGLPDGAGRDGSTAALNLNWLPEIKATDI